MKNREREITNTSLFYSILFLFTLCVSLYWQKNDFTFEAWIIEDIKTVCVVCYKAE